MSSLFCRDLLESLFVVERVRENGPEDGRTKERMKLKVQRTHTHTVLMSPSEPILRTNSEQPDEK